MKDFNEFLDEVVKDINYRLGSDYNINIERILKNNACEFVSILIDRHQDEEKGAKVTPAIYMEKWYEMYCEGYLMDDIVQEIIGVYEASLEEIKGFEEIKSDKENIASHIFFRVINADANKSILSQSPHVLFEDLAITFHYMCSNDGKMLQSFRITDTIAMSWNIDKQELYDYAMMNTPVLFPEKFMSLKNIVLEHNHEIASFEEEVDEVIDYDIPMYVLTNETGFNGASAMLYSVYLRRLAEKFESDIYVLPSSIHEVILLPDKGKMSVLELGSLVKEVNEKHVEATERLSDNVYRYSREQDDIVMCE